MWNFLFTVDGEHWHIDWIKGAHWHGTIDSQGRISMKENSWTTDGQDDPTVTLT